MLGLLKKTSVIAREVGAALNAAKKIIQARKDYWGAWLKANCELTARRAQKCMRLARHWEALEGKGYNPANASIEQNLALLASVDAAMFPNGRPSTKAPPAATVALPLQVASDEVPEYQRELAQELVQDNRLDFSDDSPAGKLVRVIVAYAVQQESAMRFKASACHSARRSGGTRISVLSPTPSRCSPLT